ncbi:kinase-like domain-containing protein [Rhizophagus clarus]|uniref:Kinase-like domain-containing protein n=1 Tax=Rhizophagus clarus TaxID=94130 RepID=A0A8H3QXX9_9GLOM|nr:kinase-like domain-containing protein [Rhizophagus clarus]
MSKNVEFINNLNDWNEWIEDAISKKLIKYYEYKDFSDIQEIGFGGFARVSRANWKKSHIRYAIKSFLKIDNATIKAIVHEIQLQREVDYHDNVIRFYGITSSFKENQKKEYSLVIEYADHGTLRSYLKENFENLNWNDKYKLALQLVHAVSCLHDEGIIHRDLHSNNVLVHQHTVKLSDFGLSKRIEETSNSQSIFGLIPYTDPKIFNRNISPLYLLNKKSDVYSIGVVLWEVSSGRPPFHGTPYDVGLAISILQGLRETPVPETSENYIKIYTDCWNIEPDNRPTINQVFNELKAIIIKENIIIEDFHLYDDNKDVIRSFSNRQPNSDAEILENNNYSSHENSSQVIDFTRTREIKSSMLSNNKTKDEDSSQVIDFTRTREIKSLMLSNNKTKDENSSQVIDFTRTREIKSSMLSNNKTKNENSSQVIDFTRTREIKSSMLSNNKTKDENSSQVIDFTRTREIKSSMLSNNKTKDDFNIIVNNIINFFENSSIEIEKQQVLNYFNNQNIILQEINNLLLNNQNNPNYIFLLGKFNHLGIEIDIDTEKAFELYQKAADLENATGINSLGYCYQHGIGTDIDEKKAFKLYQEAADLENATGINSLGYCYQHGIGTDVNKKKAFELYQKAADLENADGTNNLGYCYHHEIGIDIDKEMQT